MDSKNIKVTKEIHPVWITYQQAQERYPSPIWHEMPPCFVGKWHYIYKSPKGRISLIELADEFHNFAPWEICGTMTPDHSIERFETFEDAEKRIKELLE